WTYLWSESRKLGGKPGLWFSVMGRTPAPVPVPQAAPTAEPAAARPASRQPVRPMARSARPARPDTTAAAGPEVRIACIDIGGGTSDLMIAAYQCKQDPGGDRILGETLHRDGVSIAGDVLV